MFYLCREKNKTLFWANKALFYRLRKRNANRNIQKTASNHNFWICREYAFCLRFEAVYVCVCAGQSKTGSIVKAFETLLIDTVGSGTRNPSGPSYKAKARLVVLGYLDPKN